MFNQHSLYTLLVLLQKKSRSRYYLHRKHAGSKQVRNYMRQETGREVLTLLNDTLTLCLLNFLLSHGSWWERYEAMRRWEEELLPSPPVKRTWPKRPAVPPGAGGRRSCCWRCCRRCRRCHRCRSYPDSTQSFHRWHLKSARLHLSCKTAWRHSPSWSPLCHLQPLWEWKGC